MWITREPKKLELWNKRHFEEKRTENVQHVQYVYLLTKYIKYNVCRLAVRYVLYIYDISRLRVKTRFLCSSTLFSRWLCHWWDNMANWQTRTDHSRQYDMVHVLYVLDTDATNAHTECLLLSYGNNGYTNIPQRYFHMHVACLGRSPPPVT
jgi:hypothetical protein